jgi:hypothetical protein
MGLGDAYSVLLLNTGALSCFSILFFLFIFKSLFLFFTTLVLFLLIPPSVPMFSCANVGLVGQSVEGSVSARFCQTLKLGHTYGKPLFPKGSR